MHKRDTPNAVRWHIRRHHAILHEHPEVKELFGSDSTSAIWVAILVIAQLSLAIWTAYIPFWALIVLSLTIGTFIAHALGVLIHEATHNLIFKQAWMNKAFAILANLPHGAPAAIEFRYQHLLHHKYLGDTDEPDGGDTQAPTQREIDIVGHSTIRKLLSFAFGRFFYIGRKANVVPHDWWFVANIVGCVLTDGILFGILGLYPLMFLLISAMMAFGPHVVGMRRLSEHITLRSGQPTNSYYGILNHVIFDVGYHVEHHDFASIPWSRLRCLHSIAHIYYDGLVMIPSWGRLMIAYFFNPQFNVSQYTGLSTDYLEGRYETMFVRKHDKNIDCV